MAAAGARDGVGREVKAFDGEGGVDVAMDDAAVSGLGSGYCGFPFRRVEV